MRRELPYVVSQAQLKARKDKDLKDLLYSFLKDISLLPSSKEKLDFVRSGVDQYLKTEMTGTACLKGCHHCCHHLIATSPMEMESILEVSQSYDLERLKKQKEKIESGVEIEYSEKACVFLNNGNCSIYDQRPLICRLTHVKSEPENCHIENESKNVEHLPVTKAALLVGAFYISNPEIELIPDLLP
jgi:uncharacterized protein